MAFFIDMTPWRYVAGGSILTAVGWLEEGQSYATGDTPTDVVEKLDRICRIKLSVVGMLGIHECTLCPPENQERRAQLAAGVNNLIVPGDTATFVFPELIVHYIRDHGYAPPAEFCDAVRRCPEPDTDAYIEAVTLCRTRLGLERKRRRGMQLV
jgi:hypothetical protein